MLLPAHFLLLLLLFLGAPRTALSRDFHRAQSIFSCINTVLSEARSHQPEDTALLSKRGFPYTPGQDPSSGEEAEKDEEENKEKRNFPGSGGGGAAGGSRFKHLSQAQLRGRLYQDKAKSDQRTKFTLSLDVPTNIMNILFDIAKAKNLRAKAAANAHLMAEMGRKK